MTERCEEQAWLRLAGAAGIGPHTIRRLLAEHGDVLAVVAAADAGTLAAGDAEMKDSMRITLAAAIRRSTPGDERQRLSRLGGVLVPYTDDRYPPPLLSVPDPPPLLRMAGDPACLASPCVAVVGTRRCSTGGLQQADRFSSSLASAGVTVVSGGARGIDAAAHRGALRVGGRTVVVLGSGLCRPYPPDHTRLFDEVRSSGGLIVSELPVDQPPRPGQFPRRNRIISGLSLGVLLIEAPRRSGASLTARIAVESHGRDCWVVAADAGRREAVGGMEAVRDGWAQCVVEPADVLADVLTSAAAPAQQMPAIEEVASCSPADRAVIDALRQGAVSWASLADATNIEARAVLAAATSLELMGAVRRDGDRIGLTPAGVAMAAAVRREQDAKQ